MLKLKKIIGVSLLIAATSMSAQAKFVLDTFEYGALSGGNLGAVTYDDDGATLLPDTFGAGSGSGGTFFTTDVFYPANPGLADVTGQVGTILGYSEAGALTIYDFNSSTGTNTINPNVTTGNGILNVASDATSGWGLDISYSDPIGDNTQDFAASGDSFYFDVITADFGSSNSFTVSVTVYDTSGASSTANVDVPTGEITNQTLLLAFSEFAGVDFSKVSGVVAKILADGPSLDVQLSEVGIVPEPSALAILGLGLIGLGLRRRKLV
jgi:hypothetical protein